MLHYFNVKFDSMMTQRTMNVLTNCTDPDAGYEPPRCLHRLLSNFKSCQERFITQLGIANIDVLQLRVSTYIRVDRLTCVIRLTYVLVLRTIDPISIRPRIQTGCNYLVLNPN